MDKLDSKPLFNIVSGITILCIIVGSQWYLCPDIITRIIFTFHIPVLFIISGYFLELFIIKTCELDILMFDTRISIWTYIYSASLTIFFTVIVSIVTYFALKKIDMIESLKSVE